VTGQLKWWTTPILFWLNKLISYQDIMILLWDFVVAASVFLWALFMVALSLTLCRNLLFWVYGLFYVFGYSCIWCDWCVSYTVLSTVLYAYTGKKILIRLQRWWKTSFSTIKDMYMIKDLSGVASGLNCTIK
jgi:hypothetical protein